MKIGFIFRKIWIRIIYFIRIIRESYNYLLNFIYENSFKKTDVSKIKILLTIQEGALGDTYNFIGILNKLSEDYPNLKIYCLTNKNNEGLYKNPRLNIISADIAKEMIIKKEIDALITSGSIKHFFNKKRIVFNIPYRSGRPFPYKDRKVTQELIPMFKKLGFEIKDIKFYFTEEGERTTKIFKGENNLKKPVILLHAGCGRTVRALKEGKIPASLWPAENWARVADYLTERYNGTIIFTGGIEEKIIINDIIEKIKHKENIVNTAGKLSVEEVASIGKIGDLAIGVDSGITHVLSQTGIPIVILFSAYKPKVSGPHNKSINVCNPEVCNGCRKYFCPEGNSVCINKITVEDVLNKLPEL
jgi:ADP-heptose:LPS heptosyltransferase